MAPSDSPPFSRNAISPARLLRYAVLKTRRDLARKKGLPFNLALQGGGALGAFTWGVLDRLLEEQSVRIHAISGASAGALNAAVLSTGLTAGGRAGARRALTAFWDEVSQAASFAQFLSTPLAVSGQKDLWMRTVGAHAGLAGNPLRDILSRHVSIDRLRSTGAPRLYVSATNVLTAKARIFTNADLSIDALLASACIPNLHPTVIVDDEPYWDGGFTANPPIAPLLSSDVGRTLLVRLIRPGADAAPRAPGAVDLYLKTLLFGRPLDYELARLARQTSTRRIYEIDAGAHELEADVMSEPTRRLVRALFARGRDAGNDYVERLPLADRAGAAADAAALW